MKASDFFTLPASLARFAPFFRAEVAPWEWLKQIGTALAAIAEPTGTPNAPPGLHLEGKMWIHPSTKLPAHGTIIGPVWIGPDCDIRPGAFIRGNLIAGAKCVLGNACEFKNAVLMDGVQVPHFTYVGDSILGNQAHLGAGAICSNLRLDQRTIIVRVGQANYDTGLRKFGAILGDQAEVGCNVVLNPGTTLGKRALITPAMAFGGHLPANTMARARPAVKLTPRHD